MTRTTRRARPEGAALDRFLESIRLGLPIRDACARAGWSTSSLYNWQNEAEDATERGGKLTDRERLLVDFLERWQKADADLVTGHLAVITRAGQSGAPGSWRASAWLLSRKRPHDFGERIELTGPDGGPVEIDVSIRDQFVAKVDEMAERLILAHAPEEEAAAPASSNGHG